MELGSILQQGQVCRSSAVRAARAVPVQYRAHDIAANSADIAAPTLEDLVEQMAVQPRGSKAMLRWVRRFQDLPTAEMGCRSQAAQLADR
jgi:hypothetical protein